jgi:hypothetical protein
MADAMGSLENFSPAFSDHHSTRHQLQSKEETNPSYSKRFWCAMTNRGESAARGETVAPLPTDCELQKLTSKPLQPKGKHQKIEETSADSPTRRI